MKRFETRETEEAFKYAKAGGQALHLWSSIKMIWHEAPSCFKKTNHWAHLIDYNEKRLKETARKLGLKVIKVDRKGMRGQHVDLCGMPLSRAISLCVDYEKKTNANKKGGINAKE